MQTIPSIDLYRELEVDPGASVETIDAAWKSLLKRHHPDVAPDTSAALERVKRLNLAHEWLSDPRMRASYDRSRRQAGVIIVPRPESDRGGRAGRTPTTMSPNPAGPARPDVLAGKEPPTAGGTAQQTGRSTDVPPTSTTSASVGKPVGRGGRRIPAVVLPVALVSVLMVVAISSYLASIRTAPTSVAVVASPSRLPGAGLPSGSMLAVNPGRILPSGAVDPRGLAPPDIGAQLPANCNKANVGRAFSFEVAIGDAPGEVFVVQCDAMRSFGPLVYVASAGGWQLKGRLGPHDGTAYQGFSGPLTGRSPDEFGIAWTRGDGSTSTVTLYRITTSVTAFWDSSSIGLAWSLARFTYQGQPDPTAPGSLIVVSADLRTGTPNCVACKDHLLYRETYQWDPARPMPILHVTAREPAGVGPP